MPNRYYYYLHAYSRGVDKRLVFLDDYDYIRFFFALLLSLRPLAPSAANFIQRIDKNLANPKLFTKTSLNRLYGKPAVTVLSAVLMPNHFHLHLRLDRPQAYTRLLRRLVDSYTKYFNTRYEREGRLFSTATKTVAIVTDEQNLYLNKYIHLNPVTSTKTHDLAEKLEKFRWSTYPYYLGKPNQYSIREGFCFDASFFCNPQPILEQFSDLRDYKQFILEKEDIEKVLNKKELIDRPN